jgi:hypothetical protein
MRLKDVRLGMLIYVSGPLTAEEEHVSLNNVKKAIKAGADILKRGHIPFIPHLTFFVEQKMGDKRPDRDWWLVRDSLIEERSHGVYNFGSSRGADFEVAKARVLKEERDGMEIYFSIDELPENKPEQGVPTILYVSMPVNQSIEEMIQVGIEVIEKGHYPVIPALYLFHYFDAISKEYNYNFDKSTYISVAERWFQQICDSVLIIDGGDGIVTEGKARDLNKHIFSRLEDVPRI